MKNIGNTTTPYNLQVENNLFVGNDLTVQDTTTTGTLNSQTSNTQTLNSQTVNTSGTTTTNVLNTQSLNINGAPIIISQGSWSPVFQTLRGFRNGTPLVYENWTGQTDTQTAGMYTRVGSSVTLWFTAKCSFNGFNNDAIFAPRYPIIRNLPFRCYNPDTEVQLEFEFFAFNISYPNNVTLPQIPFLVTNDGEYTCILYEKDKLFTPRLPPDYNTSGLDTIIMDGKTIFFECVQSQITVPNVPAPPAPIEIPEVRWTREGTVTNLQVLSTGSYTISFTGSLSYFTDE